MLPIIDPKTISNQPKLILGQKGSAGNAVGQFNGPRGVCVNSKDEIIVLEYGNHRIQIFNNEGRFLSNFGSNGNANGQLNSPFGINHN